MVAIRLGEASQRAQKLVVEALKPGPETVATQRQLYTGGIAPV